MQYKTIIQNGEINVGAEVEKRGRASSNIESKPLRDEPVKMVLILVRFKSNPVRNDDMTPAALGMLTSS